MRIETVLDGETNGRKSYDFGQASNSSLCRPFSDTHFLRDFSPGVPLCPQIGDPSSIHNDFGSPKARSLGARNIETSTYPLRNSHTLLFCDCGDDSDHCVLKDTAGIEILFSETSVANATSSKSIQVLKSFQHTLSRETVKRPKEKHIELSLTRFPKHSLEIGTVVR